MISERNESSLRLAIINLQKANASRQRKSFGTGTTWIEKERGTYLLNKGLVTVTENENIGLETGYLGLHGAVQAEGMSKDMDHENPSTIELNDSLGLKAWGQETLIHISADCGDRCQPLQLVIDLEASNVPGVKNVIDSRKQIWDLGIKHSVSIRNNADGVSLTHI